MTRERFIEVFRQIHPSLKLNGMSEEDFQKLVAKAIKQADGSSYSWLLLRTFLKRAGATGMI